MDCPGCIHRTCLQTFGGIRSPSPWTENDEICKIIADKQVMILCAWGLNAFWQNINVPIIPLLTFMNAFYIWNAVRVKGNMSRTTCCRIGR